eukprot:6203643-Pleurochrysis_carterae.AAC.1
MHPQHTSHSPLAPLGARIRIFGRVLQSFAIGRSPCACRQPVELAQVSSEPIHERRAPPHVPLAWNYELYPVHVACWHADTCNILVY